MANNKDLNRLKIVLAEKKEVQSLAVKTVGICANDSIQMVYQLFTTTVGDVDEDNEVA